MSVSYMKNALMSARKRQLTASPDEQPFVNLKVVVGDPLQSNIFQLHLL